MELLKYTNLEIEVNFVNETIITAITALLKQHGYEEFSQEMGMDESGVYFKNKVVFFPKESLGAKLQMR